MAKPAKKQRPPRLGLWGPNVKVHFGIHAQDSYNRRFKKHGVTEDQLKALIREPNAGRKDIWCPKVPHRIRRWIRVRWEDIDHLVRVPFEVSTEATQTDPGTIEVITLFDDEQPDDE